MKIESDTKLFHRSMQKPGTELHLKCIPSLNYFPFKFFYFVKKVKSCKNAHFGYTY